MANRLTFAAELDFETTTSYNLTVTVTDSGSPARSVEILLTVAVNPINEGGPVFPQSLYTHSMTENSAFGSTVITITATDVDGDIHEQGRRSYSFISGNDDSMFQVCRERIHVY